MLFSKSPSIYSQWTSEGRHYCRNPVHSCKKINVIIYNHLHPRPRIPAPRQNYPHPFRISPIRQTTRPHALITPMSHRTPTTPAQTKPATNPHIPAKLILPPMTHPTLCVYGYNHTPGAKTATASWENCGGNLSSAIARSGGVPLTTPSTATRTGNSSSYPPTTNPHVGNANGCPPTANVRVGNASLCPPTANARMGNPSWCPPIANPRMGNASWCPPTANTRVGNASLAIFIHTPKAETHGFER